jgi:hypothetical protein
MFKQPKESFNVEQMKPVNPDVRPSFGAKPADSFRIVPPSSEKLTNPSSFMKSPGGSSQKSMSPKQLRFLHVRSHVKGF